MEALVSNDHVAPYIPPPDRPGGTGHEERGYPSRDADFHREAPIVRGCTYCGSLGLHWRHCPQFVWLQRVQRPVSVRPLVTWAIAVFCAGLTLGIVLTLALSAAASTASHRDDHGATFDTAAVRAGNDAPSVELEARAGMESRHDRWAKSEGRSDTAPDNSPASDLYGPDAPAAAPARTVQPRASDSSTSSEAAKAEPSDILALIHAAATEFGVDPVRLEAVARCESSLLPEPRIGQAQELGWFQWQPRTWEWLAAKSGLGYTWRDIVDERAQARLTAWSFANGYASHWACAK